MAAEFKCTWFFEGVQPNDAGTTASAALGWTETFYGLFDSIEQCLIEMRKTDKVAGNAYLGFRLDCLATLYRCVWCRASQVDNPHNTKTVGLATVAKGKAGSAADPGSTAAQINCALLVDLVAPSQAPGEPNHHRRFLVRGMTAAMIHGNIAAESSGNFQSMTRFLDVVARGRSPIGVGGTQPPVSQWHLRFEKYNTPKLPITALTIEDARNIQVTAGLGAVTMGERFNITRGRGIQGINRQWTALESANAGVYLLGKARKDLAGTYTGNGVIQKVDYDYRPANQYTIIGLRNKKTGIPFHLTRGRRRAS